MRFLRKAAQNYAHARARLPRPPALWLLTLACLTLSPAALLRLSSASAAKSPARESAKGVARLGESVGVRAEGRGHPFVKLNDGRDLLADYEDAAGLLAAPGGQRALALASADFDEDGMPDLVCGYAHAGGGTVTLYRGNVDSVYPNSPDAKRRQLAGEFTEAPFLSPARAFATSAAPDFLGVGDFDADGHWDVVAATRGGDLLQLLRGDGGGRFEPARPIKLPGAATAFVAGEINRRDGLTDLVIAVDGDAGPRAVVYEGPGGALRVDASGADAGVASRASAADAARVEPEVFKLPAPATSLALGFLDEHYAADLAVAAGSEVIVISGRDRRLSYDESARARVAPARVRRHRFDARVRSVAASYFNSDERAQLAVLTEDGSVQLLARVAKEARKTPRGASDEAKAREAARRALGEERRLLSADDGAARGEAAGVWKRTALASKRWPGASALAPARVSSYPTDDLLLTDAAGRLHILSDVAGSRGGEKTSGLVTTLDVDGAPAAVLPMRLDPDALSDLVVLRAGSAAPSILRTGAGAPVEGLTSPPVTFYNNAPITFPGVSGPATPYPSTITVSGMTGAVDKVRVRLFNMNVRTARDVDVLLVGPAGQKVLLMSDAGGNNGTRDATLTFDDDAATFVGFVETGAYKPTDIDAGADTFPAPAPAGPYGTTLSAFNGTDPNGIWSLYVFDDEVEFAALTGSNIGDGWSLTFGTGQSQPPFVVTNTNDGGEGSLRAAILDANSTAGADAIHFSIGTGVQTINLASDLPKVTEAVTIDATTQPGFAGAPIIELSGGDDDDFFGGLTLSGGSSTVRGLVINRCGGHAITLGLNGNNLIEGNYIGTNVAGSARRGACGGVGTVIGFDESNDNLIGGTTPAARNVICVTGLGVELDFFGATRNTVQGNYIGVSAAGTAIEGSGHIGVDIASDNNTVGGTTAGARNVISGNERDGVHIAFRRGNLVQGNFLGTDASGTAAVGPPATIAGGVSTIFASDNTVGGTTPAARNVISGNAHAISIGNAASAGAATGNMIQGNFIGTDATGENPLGNLFGAVFLPSKAQDNLVEGNRIAFNGGDGVSIPGVTSDSSIPVRISIESNEIYGNTGLGIDLGDSGITANDPSDADAGANLQQNFPAFTSIVYPPAASAAGGDAARPLATTITVNGTLNSTPNKTFNIHWYFSADHQCSNNQQQSRTLVAGRVPNVVTDAQGNASFSFPFTFPPGVHVGIINSTARDEEGNTSEFSSCRIVTDTPCSYSLAPTSQQFTSAGGAGSFTVNTTAGCPWAATKSADWITLAPPAAGSGNGTVNFTVAANQTPAERTATITVEGQTFTVTQGALTCPAVAEMQPASGSEGDTVNLIGSGFAGVTAVRFFNFRNAAFTVNGDTQISATVPLFVSTGPITLVKSGCADTQAPTFTVLQPKPAPSITRISPAAKNAGEGDFALVVSGSNFVDTSKVRWNGSDRPTVFVNSGQLTASIPAADIAAPGSASVTVFTPAPGGGTSAPLSFTINCAISLSSAGQDFNSAGGAGSFAVNAPGCNWSASSDAAWLTTSSAGAGSGTVNFNVAPNQTGAARAATITVTGQTFRVTQSAAAVAPQTFISPGLVSINDGGVSTPYPSQLSVSGLSGTVASLSVTLYKLGHAFPGDVDILLVGPAGQRLILMSDAGGGTDIANATLTFDDAAPAPLTPAPITPGTFKPTNLEGSETFPPPAPPGLPTGTALSVFNGTNPNGTWSLYVMDDALPDAGALGGGWSLSVRTAAACNYSVTSSTTSFTPAGGQGTATVSAPAGCAWQASSLAPWITITAGAGGTGSGTINFSVAANAGTQRAGVISAAGQTLRVAQSAAAGCEAAIHPALRAFGPAAGAGRATVVAAAQCAWSAASNADWITVTAGASGAGTGRVRYGVAANQSSATRTGTISIAGITHTVTQTSALTTPTVRFAAPTHSVAENVAGSTVTLTVVREGDTAGGVTVEYATVDDPAAVPCSPVLTPLRGTAYARCDYATTIDTLTFLPGETQKTVTVPLLNDVHAEGAESFLVTLRDAQGASLVAPSSVNVTITDDDPPQTTPNPLLQNNAAGFNYFVRMHYLDFLSREPEVGQPWTNVLLNCPNADNLDAASAAAGCDRILVSGAFFNSPEFRLKGFFVFLFHKVSFGARANPNYLPSYDAIIGDMRRVSGATGEQVFAKRLDFTEDWVARADFRARYDALTNAQYVDALLDNVGAALATPDPQSGVTRNSLVADLNANAKTRAEVLRLVVESEEVNRLQFNRAFVAMQYYGYLRRTPESGGYNAWLAALLRGENPRAMIDGFMNSVEYRFRFGPDLR